MKAGDFVDAGKAFSMKAAGFVDAGKHYFREISRGFVDANQKFRVKIFQNLLCQRVTFVGILGKKYLGKKARGGKI